MININIVTNYMKSAFLFPPSHNLCPIVYSNIERCSKKNKSFVCILFLWSLSHDSSTNADEPAKPRVLRFTWSMKTTSPLMPDEIMQKIRLVLDKNNCDYEQRERFVQAAILTQIFIFNINFFLIDLCYGVFMEIRTRTL